MLWRWNESVQWEPSASVTGGCWLLRFPQCDQASDHWGLRKREKHSLKEVKFSLLTSMPPSASMRAVTVLGRPCQWNKHSFLSQAPGSSALNSQSFLKDDRFISRTVLKNSNHSMNEWVNERMAFSLSVAIYHDLRHPPSRSLSFPPLNGH